MKNSAKRELVNDVLTGLLVAATFAVITPEASMAQNLAAAATNAETTVLGPALRVVTYISYALGTVLTITGIAGAKKHADNASSNPLAPAIGKLGAGAAFLAAPTVIGMLQGTGTGTTGGTPSTIGTGITF